jgi:hypothetical protein
MLEHSEFVTTIHKHDGLLRNIAQKYYTLAPYN